MGAIYNGIHIAKPIWNGHHVNAIYNGKKVWGNMIPFFADGFIMTGGKNVAYTIGSDVLNWTITEAIKSGQLRGVAFNHNDNVVIAGAGASSVYAKDKVTWKGLTRELTNIECKGSLYRATAGVYLVSGIMSLGVFDWSWTRPEYILESIIPEIDGAVMAVAGYWNAMAITDAVCVVVGQRPDADSSTKMDDVCNFCFTSNWSSYGTWWQFGTIGGTSARSYKWTDIIYKEGRGVIVGSHGYVYFSSSPSDFSFLSNGVIKSYPSGMSSLQGVTCDSNKFVGVGSNVIAYASFSDYSSLDWVIIDLPGDWRSVAYGSGTFVAVATDKIAYSSNAVNWSTVSLPGSWSKIKFYA
ncbi:MAG: hypothetical protein LBP59_10455 [Planctomycetaceae bacterium]|jgi:hypothetical protein|nr:hypothetical protein [Planctomycetaceae bacterium]